MKQLGFSFILLLIPLSIQAQPKPVYNVGVLVDTVTPEIEPILGLMQAEVRAVVGEDAEVNFPVEFSLSNDYNISTAESNYQALLENDIDIILAFGAINSAVVSGQPVYPKPTILFGTANLDLIDLSQARDTSGVNNFTYLLTSQSYTNDLQTFKTLVDFQHVGVLIEEAYADILPVREVLDQVLADLGAEYTLISYSDPSNLAPHYDQIDAVYLAEGFLLLPEEIEILADTLKERRLPSFTSTPRQDVELGLLATNQAEENLGQFFRRIALSIESVVNGVNLSSLPIQIELNPTLTVNWNTAEIVGVPIRYSIIATTEFVGEFENVISEKTYSLLDVLEEMLDRNLLLGLTRKNVELADQDVRSAQSNYLPSVTASATGTYIDSETAELSNGSNPEYSTGGNISVSQIIFSEQANAGISIQKSLARAERENFSTTQLDLILNASNVYFNALILKANLQIRAQNLNVTRQNLKIAESNFEAGQAGRSDILRFQSELAQNMQAVIEGVNALEQGFIALNELLNHPIDREIDVEDARINEGVFEQYDYEQIREFLDDPSIQSIFIDFLVSEAKKNAPELRALSYNMEAIERNILLNGARRFIPTVAAQAQYNRTFDQWGVGVPPPEFALNDNYNVGISLSLPIFDQNRRNIDRQTAIIQKQQLALNQENTALEIERNVKNAVLDMVNQIANIELSQVSEESANESLELMQAAYSSGAATLVQLLDAQNNFLQAQLARANASYNYLLSSLLLERYIGYVFLLHDEEENNAFRNRFFEYMDRQ